VHACEVADDLGIIKVIFPPHASTLSAWGILWSDIVHDLASTQIGLLAASGSALEASAARLLGEASRLLDEDGVPETARRAIWSLDLRYAGQAFDLNVVLDGADFSDVGLAKAAQAFHALHKQRFSYDEPAVPVEAVALRLSSIGGLAKPVTDKSDDIATESGPSVRPVWTRDGFTETAIWQREAIGAAVIEGPAVVEEVYTSSYIPPGWIADMLPSGALVARKSSIKPSL
jgi:N-methylhydantoinase A